MLAKLDIMVRFWQLRARNAELCKPLSAAERAELLALLRLVAADRGFPAADLPLQVPVGVSVQLVTDRGVSRGQLRLVCLDGLVVSCAAAIGLQQSATARIADAVSGVEYAVPCVVVRSFPGPLPALGLQVDGCPSRTPFATLAEPLAWHAQPAWGATPWTAPASPAAAAAPLNATRSPARARRSGT